MRPTVTVDTSRFDAAWKEYLPKTKRSLADAVNARTFFLMLRLYILLPPKSPQAARNKILDYFNRPVGERRRDKKTGKLKPITPDMALDLATNFAIEEPESSLQVAIEILKDCIPLHSDCLTFFGPKF